MLIRRSVIKLTLLIGRYDDDLAAKEKKKLHYI